MIIFPELVNIGSIMNSQAAEKQSTDSHLPSLTAGRDRQMTSLPERPHIAPKGWLLLTGIYQPRSGRKYVPQ